MSRDSVGELRDPRGTRESYLQVAEDERTAVRERNEAGIPPLKSSLSLIRVAAALYSAGAETSECRDALNAAVDANLEFLRQKAYRLPGYGTIRVDLEVFGAAGLVARGPELAAAFARCEIVAPPPAPLAALRQQLIALWSGAGVAPSAAEAAALAKLPKEWKPLPALFEAAAARDTSGFRERLDAYLKQSWAKEVRLAARSAQYAGRWSFLSAGLCQRMGGVPDLSDEAMQYVPVELIDA
jgi:hypothetical protein